MDWKSAAVAAFVAFMFVLQGISCWRRSEASSYGSALGVLTILLALLGFASHFLLASGALAFSPEYGVVMVQGLAARAALFVLLGGIPVAAAVGIHISNRLAGVESNWRPLVIVAAVVGGLAASRVESLDSEFGPPIHAYDIWWPVLPIWIGLSFVECMLTLGRARRRSLKLGIEMVFAVGVSLWATRRDHLGLYYADPQSIQLWWLTLCIGLSVLLGATVWRFRPAWRQRWRLVLNVAWTILAVLAGALGLFSSLSLWLAQNGTLPVPLRPWFLWTVWVVIAAVFAALLVWRRWKSNGLRMPDFGRPGRWDDVLGAIALLAIALGLTDAFYLRSANPVLALILVLVGWGTLVEVIAIGPLAAFFRRPLAQSVRAAGTWTVAARHYLSDVTRQSSTTAAHGVKWFFNFGSAGVGAMRLLLLALALVALAELPHARSTVVVPFNTLGLSDEESKDFGRMISHRVVNAFGTLARDLQPEVAIALPTDDRTEPKFAIVPGDASERPEAAVGSGDIDIGGVKIPVTLVTGWIQAPMRSLLGVRVVTGSVQKDGNGYVLLVRSSDGGIWRVPDASLLVAESASTEGAASSAKPPAPNTAAREAAAERMARELAYKLISTLPAMRRTGMTQSWQAALPFTEGLGAWHRYETGREDYDGLTEAIGHLQEAIRIDPDFALAHYRLGLALQADGQSFAATESFRRSLQANPDFALAHNALASHVYFNRRAYYAPATIEPADESSLDPHDADIREALKSWHRVLEFHGAQIPTLDRASAHYGLCRAAVDNDLIAERIEPRWKYASYYLAYYHCKRALQVYAALPDVVRNSPEGRTAEGSVWNTTGVILSRSGQTTFRENRDGGWQCSDTSIVAEDLKANRRPTIFELHRSPYTKDALRYYEHATRLLPDDGIVRCNAASTAFVRDDRQPMKELAATSSAHFALADTLSRRIQGQEPDPAQYILALQEFETAFTLDPQNLMARNNYSYTVWQWHRASMLKSALRPPRHIVRAADEQAREAARLAAGKGRRLDLVYMQSTLGEVLIMQGRSHEAYGQLEAAVKRAPMHPAFDEIRWDLALAYLCAGAIDRQSGREHAHVQWFEEEASKLLEGIRTREANRETRTYTGTGLLDVNHLSGLCIPGPDGMSNDDQEGNGTRYELQTNPTQTDSYVLCNRLAMVAYVQDVNLSDSTQLGLRLWGPAMSGSTPVFRVPVGPDAVSITLPRMDTHHLYFAQLEQINGDPRSAVPISRAYPIETRSDAPCSNNRIVLTFRRPAFESRSPW